MLYVLYVLPLQHKTVLFACLLLGRAAATDTLLCTKMRNGIKRSNEDSVLR